MDRGNSSSLKEGGQKGIGAKNISSQRTDAAIAAYVRARDRERRGQQHAVYLAVALTDGQPAQAVDLMAYASLKPTQHHCCKEGQALVQRTAASRSVSR